MKILIIKTSSLGDIIQAFPIINFLKELDPEASIDWIVEREGRDLVERHPLIDSAIVVATRKWRKQPFSIETRKEVRIFKNRLQCEEYDVVFDLQGNIKSGWLTLLSRSKAKVGFGWSSVPEWPNLFFTGKKFNPPKGASIQRDLLSIVESYFKREAKNPFKSCLLRLNSNEEAELQNIVKDFFQEGAQNIVICPHSNWENKQLEIPTLVQFLKQHSECNQSQFLLSWGNDKERARCHSIIEAVPNSRILPKTPLPLLQHLMALSDLVISMDSLPLHLASLAGKPTWSIFGPSSAKKYAPLGPSHKTFQGSCPYKMVFEKRCPKLRTCKTGACMKTILPQNILDEFYK